MWCAARHCAFESHPLRHAGAKGTLLRLFFFFETSPAPRIWEGKGGLSKNKLAEWAVLEYHREKWKSSKEQRV